MFQFRLQSVHLKASPLWHDGAWRIGNDFVRPWTHEALEFFHVVCSEDKCSGRRIFLGREKINDAPFVDVPENGVISLDDTEGDAIIDAARKWPLEAIAIEILGDLERINIYRSNMTSCALYIAIDDGNFYGDWDFMRLATGLPRRTPNWRCIASFVAMEYQDIAEATPFQEITAVPSAAVCRLGKECAIERPPALPVTRPRLLKVGAKPLEVFEEVLDMVIARQLPAAGNIGVDISGGLDCAIVAHALSRAAPGRIKTFGMLFPGPRLERQEWRRAEAIGCIGADDYTIMADSSPGSIFTVEPWPFQHTCPGIESMRTPRMKDAGCKVLFGGTGGDELTILGDAEHKFAPHTELTTEHSMAACGGILKHEFASQAKLAAELDYSTPEWGRILKDNTPRLTEEECIWPYQGVSSSGIFGRWMGSTAYMREGIWQIQPFCSTEIVQFARSLPTEWRAKRRLSRDYLASRGFNKFFCYSKSKEDQMNGYWTHIPHAVEWTRRLRKNSRLIHNGVVDANRVEQLCQQLEISDNTARSNLLAQPLYVFINAERLLETFGI